MAAKREIIENAMMAAERGWRASFHFVNGSQIAGAYITAADWDNGAVQVEKVGERHKPPTLIFLAELVRVDLDWA